jgi:hypothetical protein
MHSTVPVPAVAKHLRMGHQELAHSPCRAFAKYFGAQHFKPSVGSMCVPVIDSDTQSPNQPNEKSHAFAPPIKGPDV